MGLGMKFELRRYSSKVTRGQKCHTSTHLLPVRPCAGVRVQCDWCRGCCFDLFIIVTRLAFLFVPVTLSLHNTARASTAGSVSAKNIPSIMKLTALLISSLLTLTSIASLTPSLESDLDPANLDDDLDLNDHFDLEDLSQLNDTSALEIRQNPGPGNCARGVHVIAAGGDGAPNVGHYGNIYSLVQSILYAIPGSDSVSLPYPKGSPHGIKKTEKGVSAASLPPNATIPKL